MTKKRIYIGIGCALAMFTLFYSCCGDDVPEIADIDTAAMEAIADTLPQQNAPPPAFPTLSANDQATEAPVDVTMIVEGLMTQLEVVTKRSLAKNWSDARPLHCESATNFVHGSMAFRKQIAACTRQ